MVNWIGICNWVVLGPSDAVFEFDERYKSNHRGNAKIRVVTGVQHKPAGQFIRGLEVYLILDSFRDVSFPMASSLLRNFISWL